MSDRGVARLVISYIGRSGAVERWSVTPRTAARKWPELFAELAGEVFKANSRQLELPLDSTEKPLDNPF